MDSSGGGGGGGVAKDWSFRNTYFLMLMTVGYVIGEIAHFLVNTTSRAVARDVHFGDVGCYINKTYATNSAKQDENDSAVVDSATCANIKNQTDCLELAPACEWNYTGTGVQYQVLSGNVFAITFTICCLMIGFTSDKIRRSSFGRHRLMAIGVFLFSLSCLLTGFSTAYWHLVILRVGIAAGEAVCRPISGGLVADVFSPTSRGLANGIFSWGVYFGYGLAYVIGINLTAEDLLGYGWRASYVVSALPGFVIAALLVLSVNDPASSSDSANNSDGNNAADSPIDTAADERNSTGPDSDVHSSDEDLNDGSTAETEAAILGSSKNENAAATGSQTNDDDGDSTGDDDSIKRIAWMVFKSFVQPEMLLLLLAAIVRQTAGLNWAFNTRPYFQKYYPEFEISVWLLACSIGGGGFGVFFGGWFSDRLVKKLGLHSRLWVLGAFQIIATPFAALVLYLPPPGAMVSLIAYYFCAETWFAILFTVITEICHPAVKSTCIAIFLFLMNNVGGNLPVLVDPLSKAIGYREAIYVFWPGCVALCGLVFIVASIPLMRKRRQLSGAGNI